MGHAVSWFEIAVSDMERAKNFYSAILQKELPQMEGSPSPYVLLNPDDMEGIGGALAYEPDFKPSANAGTIVYLNGGDDLNHVLKRVEPAGGKVLQDKREIGGGHGYIAFFLDTEGNKVALYSSN